MSAGGFPLRVLTVALAAGCLLGLVHIVCVIGLPVPFDPNEGWNAYFAHAAMTTGSPYPPPQGLMFNNYPPLSFYLVGALGVLGGDAIIAGRVVALASLLAVASGIAAAARLMGCSRLEAAFAALFFAAGLMLTSDYAGMDDPQLLGHAIAMGGLVLALREPRTPRLMVAAAALFTLAFFVKHNLIVLPAALGLWLLLANRRLGITFVASGLIFFLVGLGLFREAFGFGLIGQIASARSYALADLWAGLLSWLPWATVPLGGAGVLLTLHRHDRDVLFCAIYGAVAVAAGVFFLGGAGVDANALFDAEIALALAAGVLMNRLSGRLHQTVAAALYAVPLAIGVWSVDDDWRDGDFWLHPMAQERAAAAHEIALIRGAHGPVLCEMLSLCYWAGKPAEVDVFNTEQAYLAGARSDTALARAVATGHYALIQLEQSEAFPLTPDIKRALDARYRVVRSDDDRVFLIPR